ncbi:MAG: FHA domain-containing protein [Planctomycetes bacterium]|nr:FHA domain-containing protein [Planctomycetota bacterium]
MAKNYSQVGVVRGNDEGKKWLLKPSDYYDLGRSSKNRIPLKDKTISKRHALLECLDGIWFIQDLGSRHGTFVNEEQIEERKALFHKDVIRLGKTYLVYGNVEEGAVINDTPEEDKEGSPDEEDEEADEEQ